MLRSGIGLLSDDFPDPEAIEDGARVMLRRFLESGVVDAYLADSDSD